MSIFNRYVTNYQRVTIMTSVSTTMIIDQLPEGISLGDYVDQTIVSIDVLFPLVGWLIEGFVYPSLQEVNADRWYTSDWPLYSYWK